MSDCFRIEGCKIIGSEAFKAYKHPLFHTSSFTSSHYWLSPPTEGLYCRSSGSGSELLVPHRCSRATHTRSASRCASLSPFGLIILVEVRPACRRVLALCAVLNLGSREHHLGVRVCERLLSNSWFKPHWFGSVQGLQTSSLPD